ncbi:hypothetical protein KAU33_09105 [Candidatus Dependentiae bacterium]|nr:hypothetical protein [Candidatus Dependentiae bacterium]
MSFKVVFFLIVSYGKYDRFTRLKREYSLQFVPIPGIKIKIDKKTHFIEDVTYDLDTDTFNVILEDDESSRYTCRVIKLDTLTDLYIKNGWEKFTPMDYKNVITTPEMHDIIVAVNDVKEVLKPDAFTEMVCAIMIQAKFARSIELRELLYFCDLSTCQSIGIMERFKELSDLKRE